MQDLGEDAPLHIGGLRLHCVGDNVQQVAQGGHTAQGRRKNVRKSFLIINMSKNIHTWYLHHPGAAAGQAKVCKGASQTEFR